MSKRKADNRAKWENFKKSTSEKRSGKKSDTGSTTNTMEYLTVQRLSATVEGKCQKYSRIGPLTMVPFGEELTFDNIKTACIKHFKIPSNMECDILAGERGPSFNEIGQIKNWKVVHVRFVETVETSSVENVTGEGRKKSKSSFPKVSSVFMSSPINLSASATSQRETSHVCQSNMPASVSLSAMLKIGKIIPPSKEMVTICLEEFSVEQKAWLDPFEARLSVAKTKFASGGFRDAFETTALSGDLQGKYVLKKYRSDQLPKIEELFGSMEIHTRKTVQMHCLARNFAKSLENECPPEYGDTFKYNKVYYGKMGSEYITLERFIDGEFVKYINNTGDVTLPDGSEIVSKAETFVHYTYHKSSKQLMILDIQGVGYNLCDPEIASSNLTDGENEVILFCYGNLSTLAINAFVGMHKCNKYCKQLKLESF
jgi:hypothetical protein